MTIRSTLADTVLIGTMDDNSKKYKLALVALALIGVAFLLRGRGSNSEESEGDESEEETESEREKEEMEEEVETETETEQLSDSAKEELVEVRRELDVFDMLAILAAAIKAARDEYRQRAGS